MKVYSLYKTQFVPISLDEAWDFFSSPANLEKITPPEMQFVITSPVIEEMYAGQIITYTVKPLPLLKVTWITEITHVEHKKFFVDEQRSGPYKFWHHQHKFKAVAGGVEMTDIVHYALPLGILASPALPLIRKKLNAIFEFRSKIIFQMFGKEIL
jgi:ligand-binding SRPBCC domain-containing protein